MRASKEYYLEQLERAKQLADYGVEASLEDDQDPHHVLCDAVTALEKDIAEGAEPWAAYDDGEDQPDRYYKEVVQVTVLSENEQAPDDLQNIAYQIDEGDMVGVVRVSRSELTPKEMADALHDAGSTPEFFGLDDDGKKTEVG